MARFLEDELKSSELIKHCDTCVCSLKELELLADTPKTFSIGTQTIHNGSNNNSLCLRCNSNLNSPSRANSPFVMKLIKSSCNESVISDGGKSSVDHASSTGIHMPRKDDLTVNPILGHHRLCDRTTKVTLPVFDVNSSASSVKSSVNNVGNKITNSGGYDSVLEEIKNELSSIVFPGQKSPVLEPLKTTVEHEIENVEEVLQKLRNSVEVNVSSVVETGGSGESVGGGDKSVVKTENSLSGAGQGSTNSLWSRSSSNAEGVKMFENFNLNLIKTIKVC